MKDEFADQSYASCGAFRLLNRAAGHWGRIEEHVDDRTGQDCPAAPRVVIPDGVPIR